jgi:hypothetical protein
MSQPKLRLDFVARPRRLSPLQAAVLGCGMLAAIWSVSLWLGNVARTEALQLKLDERSRAVSRGGLLEAADPVLMKDAAGVVAALSVPWSHMLTDLESAGKESNGDVAVLGVEPDREHGRVTITAEARTLVAALAYLKRLQDRPAVGNALLQSHEVQDKVPDRPVRVQITAEWKRSI